MVKESGERVQDKKRNIQYKYAIKRLWNQQIEIGKALIILLWCLISILISGLDFHWLCSFFTDRPYRSWALLGCLNESLCKKLLRFVSYQLWCWCELCTPDLPTPKQSRQASLFKFQGSISKQVGQMDSIQSNLIIPSSHNPTIRLATVLQVMTKGLIIPSTLCIPFKQKRHQRLFCCFTKEVLVCNKYMLKQYGTTGYVTITPPEWNIKQSSHSCDTPQQPQHESFPVVSRIGESIREHRVCL